MTTPDFQSLVESVLQSSFPAPEEPNAVQKLYDIAIAAKPLATEVLRLRAELAEEKRKVEDLIIALEFYADPDSYFAFMFMADEPCGEFLRDFDEEHGGDYNRPMPGKTARAAIAAFTTPSEKGEVK